jgi:hypothetical protein
VCVWRMSGGRTPPEPFQTEPIGMPNESASVRLSINVGSGGGFEPAYFCLYFKEQLAI